MQVYSQGQPMPIQVYFPEKLQTSCRLFVYWEPVPVLGVVVLPQVCVKKHLKRALCPPRCVSAVAALALSGEVRYPIRRSYPRLCHPICGLGSCGAAGFLGFAA